MAYLLHIETSTDICSVALSENDTLIQLSESEVPYTHASRLTPLIQALTAKVGWSLNQLDAVCLSSGPGSYTSLRIGTATAKGLCYALDRPLVVVDTLWALALASKSEREGSVLYAPMIDARRMEVYTALFDAMGNYVTQTEAKILDENSFGSYFAKGHIIVFSGNGSPKFRDLLPTSNLAFFSPVRCSAAHLIRLGQQAYRDQQFADTAYYTPRYLKRPNVTRAKPRL